MTADTLDNVIGIPLYSQNLQPHPNNYYEVQNFK